ncbi:MAG TPA: hypothetical protein VNZ22_11240, partial [Bacillota bacterium]|nr:hypothetical protein [Bacillota bacterium]
MNQMKMNTHQLSWKWIASVTLLLGLGAAAGAQTVGGTLIEWGRNDYHQTDAPPGLTNVTAVAIGLSHGVALNRDGSVVWWNDTGVTWGQSNVVAIAAGQGLSLGVLSDGTVAGWDTPVPSGLTNIS